MSTTDLEARGVRRMSIATSLERVGAGTTLLPPKRRRPKSRPRYRQCCAISRGGVLGLFGGSKACTPLSARELIIQFDAQNRLSIN